MAAHVRGSWGHKASQMCNIIPDLTILWQVKFLGLLNRPFAFLNPLNNRAGLALDFPLALAALKYL